MPYDPYEEVFEDSNKELSESEQQQLQQDIEDKLQTLEDTNQIQQEVVDVEPQDNQVEDSNKQEPTTEPTQEVDEKDEARDRFRELLREALETDKDNFPNLALLREQAGLDPTLFDKVTTNPVYETILSPARGLNDTITDAINIIPGVNLRKSSTYQSNVAEGVRDISAIVLPTLIARRFVLRSGASIHASKVAPKAVQKLGDDAVFKWFAAFGVDIGSGVAVDAVASQNYQDQNLSGMLKEYFPKTYQWIPNTWATQDTDSPDIKRNKHVNEGAALGVLSGIVEGTAKILKAGKSVSRTTKWIPKNENAKKNLEKLLNDPLNKTKFSDNPIEDSVLRNQAKAQRELDNLADYFIQKGEPITKPELGVNDVFDVTEQGVRTMDSDGIFGAAVDAARVKDNIDSTYGRLGSVITEAARKKGLEANSMAARTLIKDLAQQIKQGGKYSQELASGKVITEEQIESAGTELAALLMDPRMPVSDMKKLLDEFKGEMNDIRAIGAKGYRGVMKALKFYMDEFLDLDVQKARAYLLTSEAGQASDLAEGMRLMDDTAAVGRAQEQILDRMEYLMVEKGLAAYQAGSSLSHLRTWKNMKGGDPEVLKETADSFSSEVNEKLVQLIPDAKNFTSTLRAMSKERPEFLKPLMLAYEHTDGNIASMYHLNKFVSNSLGVYSKAFIDMHPEIPSIVNRAQWATIFNSVLSAIATPLKALAGNVGGLIGEPASVFYGALQAGDKEILDRAFHQYGAVWDTTQKALEHLSIVYRKASTDPTSISYVVREDIALKEADKIEVLREYAKAAEANGEFGATALLNITEANNDLAAHPWLRFGANAMTALDGFSRSFNAVAEAKGQAFDALYQSGKKIDQKAFREMSNDIYKKMFDKNGMITNEAVDFATREMALNLDSTVVKGLNYVIDRVPAVKPWFMFPRTSANALDVFRKWSALDTAHAGHALQGDYAKFAGKKLDEYSMLEIKELLESRGQPFDQNALNRFKAIRYKVKGRVAIGTTTVMAAGMYYTTGGLRGNGHWDINRQRVRDASGWKRKTYRGWDGNWYSYEWLGPLGDWLALVADIGDNFDSITTPVQEKFLNKMSFILGASIGSKSFMSQLEPLNDVLRGNPKAMNRWAATFANALLPISGLRNEFGRILNPMMREADQEFFQQFQKRNNWIDIFNQEQALPAMYSFVTGKKIGYPENFWVRAWNAYSPLKKHDGQTPEEQFLIDIEYDARPNFSRSGEGIELSNTERSELSSIVGQQGYFRQELKKIMRDAEAFEHPKYGKGFVNILRNVRRGLVPSTVLKTDKFADIFRRIDTALNEATRVAEAELSSKDQIRQKKMDKNLRDYKTRKGDIDAVLNLPVR